MTRIHLIVIVCVAIGIAPMRYAPPRVSQQPKAVTTVADGIRGTASWYGATGMIGAAGPELRRWLGKNWRGTRITVISGSRSVTIRLTDWCACGVRHRLVDLSDDAFRRLAPLSQGVVKIVIPEGGN